MDAGLPIRTAGIRGAPLLGASWRPAIIASMLTVCPRFAPPPLGHAIRMHTKMAQYAIAAVGRPTQIAGLRDAQLLDALRRLAKIATMLPTSR